MIVMNVELDNLFGFQDFKINFSYPKKLVKSTIKNEYLETKPNFRYKKVNILMGANAAGKTSFGKALMAIFNFIAKRSLLSFDDALLHEDKQAYFSIDFLIDEDYLYRIVCSFLPQKVLSLDVFVSEISRTASYETCADKLKKMHSEEADYMQKLDQLPRIGWIFTFPRDERNTYLLKNDDILNLDILNAVLRTLDPSIIQVSKSTEVEKSYIIKSTNGDLFVQNGEVVDKNILSSGTKAGLDIAFFLSALCKNSYGFYYCDEQFSFIQSDVEQTILSLMISMMKPNTQLFFTTHNLDILEMTLPLHSFTFLRKNNKIEVIHPETTIKKNDISLRNAVKNDIFDISPDISKILAIEDICSEISYAQE
ncbi:MAG: ATP-binding protein [Treponema sp.]